MKLFVYGTLRKGGANHTFLDKAILLKENCWVYGELHDTKKGYPILKDHQNAIVWGEVYEVNQELLNHVDVLEGYSHTGSDNEYIRVIRQIYTEGYTLHAFVYIAGKTFHNCDQLIKSGNWFDVKPM
ncbi:gamma-glutamylcyclotransferase family protein [Halalkalibacter krulwichiae]|uniref:Gamma-glutamylcyclotransferase family protein n=1 Tax=Halalkalibacter krulwichiae TaxID=199441 RepID=A0A1X9MBA6_9BACI|nr:gamma-glutamylcyclotransferase family protein [Halalkalibacter krulwichiae]ARK30706.1 Gamma-L-glutamyl-butirosin B gamma-glutamyl cyclotransferase [Halalkalibacter krulwichiae]